MTPWGNICRVCASPADYDIFEKIPVYLHANSKDFLHWQSPIYELMQDTTGLRISRDDGLPQQICALCISYLKHAFTFREKAIEICMNFIAVKEYKEILKGKKEWNYTKTVNDILATHNKSRIINENSAAAAQSIATEDDNTTNCYYKDQNKVNKRLITSGQGNDNSNMARVLTNQTKSCLLYLSQLYDYPDMGDRMGGQGPSGFKGKQKKQNLLKSASFDMGGGWGTSGGGEKNVFSRKRQNYEDEFPRNISSDEYDEPESNGESATGGNGDSGPNKNNNIFSYKEKMFEEDDIMDLDELKDLISINIESTCKEHKCKYCSRRFMFEETIQEHLKTCVDFKFAEFYEEIKNLMYIKRCKEISPHEFIRRMVFSIRKTCVWLKENLIDTTLPDLLQSKDSAGESVDVDNVNLKVDETKTDNLLQCVETAAPAVRRNPINMSNNILHVMASSSSGRTVHTNQRVNKTVIASSFLQDKPLAASATVRQTPINISNNILHEIERSESRDSNKMLLKKPIAILATSGLNNLSNISSKITTTQNPERLAFLEKLQNASKPITPPPLVGSAAELTTVLANTPAKDNLTRQTAATNTLTPLIAVRQDLLETTTTTTTTTRTRRAHVSPLMELLQNSSKTQNNTSVNACARCPTCNLLFETLDALEIHNAMQHNTNTKAADSIRLPSAAGEQNEDTDKEAEHKRIIALFENEDEF